MSVLPLYQVDQLPPITTVRVVPCASDAGATVVTLTLNGAKSSPTRVQISLIEVSSVALNVVGSPSRSYAGEVMFENEPHEFCTCPLKSRYSVAAAPGRLASGGTSSPAIKSRPSSDSTCGWQNNSARRRDASAECERE